MKLFLIWTSGLGENVVFKKFTDGWLIHEYSVDLWGEHPFVS